MPKSPSSADAFNKLSSIVQSQLLDLPSSMSRIHVALLVSVIPLIDPFAPSVLSLPTDSNTLSTTTPVPISDDGPQESSGVMFPAIVYPNLDGITIKPVNDDIYIIIKLMESIQ